MSDVLDEIELLKYKYKVDSFYLLDDTFLLKKDRVREFIKGLEDRKIDMPWAMETRVDGFDEEIARLLSKSRCLQVDFGIESGSQAALDRMIEISNS